MKKEERLQQQCDVCGRLLDKNISNFRKYSRKTNGLNFHTTCRDCEDRIKLNTEWKDGKLLCHICGEYKEPSEFTYAGANKYTLRQNKECRCNSCKLEQRKAAIATYDNDVKLEKVLQARWLAAKSRAIDKSIPFTITKEDLLTVWKALSFPSDMFCLNEAAKDADVSPYMKSDEFEVTIGNLREYQE